MTKITFKFICKDHNKGVVGRGYALSLLDSNILYLADNNNNMDGIGIGKDRL